MGDKIGGKGVVVEVDETKFGKSKYHRGHRVEGAWVVTGIERTEQRRSFCVQVDRRDAETLERVIGENAENFQLFIPIVGRGIQTLQRPATCDI